MRVLILNQGPQEELKDYHERVNGELARLGTRVKDVQMDSGLYERRVGERIRIPMLMMSVMIVYEETE
ncbi:MAG: hypothetical protein ACUVX8_07780 [Candidatus Zipacnadales bacterium]